MRDLLELRLLEVRLSAALEQVCRCGVSHKTRVVFGDWRFLHKRLREIKHAVTATGFPGDTEAEFEELLDFLDQAQLARVGAFAYSSVDGAAANVLPNPVPELVKQERRARFLERQAAISAAKLEAKVGSVQRCIVDAIDGQLAIVRSMADAPEIDGVVQLQNGAPAGLKPGDFANVAILGGAEHDLYGEVAA